MGAFHRPLPDGGALQAPVIAALAVVTNLLATAAAFGGAKWIFQDGVGHSLLGFEPQGFLEEPTVFRRRTGACCCLSVPTL